MFNYKVEYIYSAPEKKKWHESSKKKVDAWSLAKELEALLVEYDNKGFELISIVPVTTPANSYETSSRTDGLLVTFKKSDNDLEEG